MAKKDDDGGLGDFLASIIKKAEMSDAGPDPMTEDDEAAKMTRTPSKEEAVPLLKEYLKIWQDAAKNPFQVGQLIAPRKGHNIRLAGHPCIVLERLPETLHKHSDGDKDRSGVLQLYDIIIARNMGGQMVKFYATSADYELYVDVRH